MMPRTRFTKPEDYNKKGTLRSSLSRFSTGKGRAKGFVYFTIKNPLSLIENKGCPYITGKDQRRLCLVIFHLIIYRD